MAILELRYELPRFSSLNHFQTRVYAIGVAASSDGFPGAIRTRHRPLLPAILLERSKWSADALTESLEVVGYYCGCACHLKRHRRFPLLAVSAFSLLVRRS